LRREREDGRAAGIVLRRERDVELRHCFEDGAVWFVSIVRDKRIGMKGGEDKQEGNEDRASAAREKARDGH
jgi:hypothetical protein